jgi:type IV secretory pathway VirD2 relaxase
MRHFLFEDKPYRISPYFKRQKKQQDSAVALAKLLKKLTPRTSSSSGGSKGFISGGSRRGVDTRQKCVVKMQYSKSGEAHRKQLEEYLVREGTDIDGSRAKLYGTDLDEYRQNMVDKNFRIFLSPQSDKINLNDMAEKFIKKLEQQTGYTFYWQAANHYNTAHPHAHLLINGIDKNGKEIERFHPDIVKTFMREYARDICTSQIGYRTAAEIAIEKEKELEAQRFTNIDKTIKELGGDSGKVYTSIIYSDRQRILTRLENLRKMGMCTYDKGAYQLTDQWDENLKANARYNTFLTARTELKYADPSKLKVYTGEHGTISGKVTKIYRLDDDASDNHAIVVESLDGKTAYFVPLYKAPELINGKDKTKTRLKEGEMVNLKTYESQKGRLTPVIFKKADKQDYSRRAG